MKNLRKFTLTDIIYRFFAWLLVLVFIYPVYFTVISSFKNNNEIWDTMFSLPTTWRFSNYYDAVTNVNIFRSIFNSVMFSTCATLIMVVAVTMASYVISRNMLRISGALRLYYLLCFMIPAYCMLIPVVKIFTDFHLRNNYLSMIVLYAGLNFPMSMFIITGYIRSINKEIDEAAYMDGCNMFTLVFRIIMPIAAPGIATASIMTFLSVYNELIYSNTLLDLKSMQTISVTLLAFKSERFTSLGPMLAAIVLTIIPIMIAYIIFQEQIQRGMTAGSVKG